MPPRIDVRLVSITSDPARAAIQGQWVAITVRVANHGNAPVRAPVRLTFPSASKQPEVRNVALSPGESGVAAFTWKTLNYDIGQHTLRADLLVAGNVAAAGQTSASLTVTVAAPVITAAIAGLSLAPETAYVGDPVTISVAVRNTSPVAANVPVTLHFPSPDKQPETRKPRAAPEATATAQFTWRTSRYAAGDHRFRVSVPGEERTFTATLLARTVDFAVPSVHPPDGEAPLVRGESAAISAEVHNRGPFAGTAQVSLIVSPAGIVSPTETADRADAMYRRTLSLESGASETVAFHWNTRQFEPGDYQLQVSAVADNDADSSNDVSAPVAATVLAGGDIIIGDGASRPTALLRGQLVNPGLSQHPRFAVAGIDFNPGRAVAGEPLDITVRIANHGRVTGSTPVTLHFPSPDKQPETRKPRIAPGQTAAANFTWRTGRYPPGAYTFRVAGLGFSKTFTVRLNVPDVDFALAALYPPAAGQPIVKGDWVEVAAFVQNLGNYESRATVILWDATRNDEMYRQSLTLDSGESRIVTFTWKTLRYPVGDYQLMAEVQARNDVDRSNNRSAEHPARVLTHRDITLGFGNAPPAAAATGAAAKPKVRTEGQPPTSIIALAGDDANISNLQRPASPGAFGVAPVPASAPAPDAAEPTAAELNAATIAATVRCLQWQQRAGQWLPRPLLCPNAPAFVR